jgi:hypothetical protein
MASEKGARGFGVGGRAGDKRRAEVGGVNHMFRGLDCTATVDPVRTWSALVAQDLPELRISEAQERLAHTQLDG